MLTGRAWALLSGAGLLWFASRLVGSPDLHMVALALAVLVPLAALVVRLTRHELTATRRLSSRRAFPGTRVRVDLELHNHGSRRSSFLLLEDRLPAPFGQNARAVLTDIPAGGRRTVSYHITTRSRGRYPIGPLVASVADPFDLVRQRVAFPGRHDLIVYPEVEDLAVHQVAAPAGGTGESSTRQLYRSGDDFYTMRPYEMGDDLRRIHWPSTARMGELMIRQDEASRRATAALLLDTRASTYGGASPAFERAVSAAASIGVHHLRAGYRLRVATADRPPHPVESDPLLELLALARPTRGARLEPAIRRLRPLAQGGAALVVVTGIPGPQEIATLTRLTSGYGPKLAVLVHRQDLDELTIRPRHGAEGAADAARASLARSGWDVLLIRPTGRLSDTWHLRAKRPIRATAVSS